MAETAKKKEFVEIKYTGYANGSVFDSNIEEDLRTLSPKAKVQKTIVVIGEGAVVSGLDKALEGKEIGKEYEVEINSKEGFGERNKQLIKIIPLKLFREKNANPVPGMTFTFDNALAKVIAVSGARVIVDFNNPLSGKKIKYKFSIVRKVEDEKEKIDAFFEIFLKFVPEVEIADKIIVVGPKGFDGIVNVLNDKAKELLGKELGFKEKEEKKEETKKDN
jgi:FKBP-type peptidyl-prolyl cis-trans isomerase 2